MPTAANQGNIWAGMGLSLACQLFTVFVLVLWMAISKDVLVYFAVLASGLFQWLLVVPLILRFRARGKQATVKGLWILSVVGVAVNAAVLVWISGRNANATRF